MEKMKHLLEFVKKCPFFIMMALFLFSFSAFFLCKKTTKFSEEENRYLASMPKLTWKSIEDASFGTNYEQYVNDQFPLRNQWITLKALSGTLMGRQENNNVMKGKRGYLFSKDIELSEQIDKNLNLVKKFAEGVSSLEDNHNIIVSLIPNSNSILKDYVPMGAPVIDQMQVIQHYSTELTKEDNLTFLDLAKVLKNHSSEEIYYRTDHHWTTLGAYYGYSEFIRSQGEEPVSLNDFHAQTAEGFYGTYDAKYKGLGVKPDLITYYTFPIKEMIIGDEKKDSMYDLSKLKMRDKYAMFLYGNHPLTVIRSDLENSEEGEKKILLIKDSYSNCLIPFLTNHYNTIYVVDLRYYDHSIKQLIHANEIENIWILYNFDTLMTDNHFYRLLQ